MPNPPPHIAVETLNNMTLARITFTPSAQADVAGYRLYRSVNGEAPQKIELSVATGAEAKFLNYIKSNQSYTYYVTAVDVAGNESAPSEKISTDGGDNEVDPNFPDGGDIGIPEDPNNGGDNGGDNGDGNADLHIPSAPGGLSGQTTDIGVTLSWNANASQENVTQYQVWYSNKQFGKYKLLGTTDSTTFEYIDPMAAGWYEVVRDQRRRQGLRNRRRRSK